MQGELFTKDRLSLSAETSPARISALPSMMPKASRVAAAACGKNSSGWCVKPALNYLPKTWLCCAIAALSPSCRIFMRSAWMRDATLYRLTPWAPSTIGKGYFCIPTIVASEAKGACRNRYRGAKHFRGSKMSEGLRICETDPLYTHPCFAEAMMGFPKGWTDLGD